MHYCCRIYFKFDLKKHSDKSVLVKMSLLEEPTFLIKSPQGCDVFETSNNLKVVAPNQLTELKALLASLAELQASHLTTQPIEGSSLNQIIPHSTTLKFNNNFGIAEAVEKLQPEFKRGLNLKSLFVQSIWSYPNNSYVNSKGNKVVFLKVSSSQQIVVPPLFDALLYIFALSDEKFRQQHFHQLVSYYFKQLESQLEITRSYQEALTDALLPVVKLRLAVELVKDDSAQKKLQELSTNLENYFKYPILSQEDIYEIVQNKLSSNIYDLLDYKLNPLSEINGHLGEYFHLTIQLRHENEIKQFNLFAKILMFFNETFKEIIEKGAGKKEDFFYNVLCPMYRSYGLDDLLDFAPRCYLSKLTKIVLDDLTKMNYNSMDLNQLLDIDSIKKILSKVAKLHACSFILEELLSKEAGKTIRFEKDYSEYFEEIVLVRNAKFSKFVNGMLPGLMYCIEKEPSLTDGLNLNKNELSQKFLNLIDCIYTKIQPSQKLRNVINHGDLYIGNILFKHHDNGTLEDGLLVDFQVLRLVPPGFEVMFFLTLSSNKEAKLHIKELLDYYYNQLSGHLQRFNLNPDEIYSREHFDQDIKYARSAAKIVAFQYGQLIYLNPDLRKEITRDGEKMKYYYEDNKFELMELLWEDSDFKEKILDLVKHIIDVIKDGDI